MIDAEIQSNLRQQFNPDGSELRRNQLRMLDMLKYIDDVCKENNIHYWLSSGTCIGAVRHGGFIPWDDDVDIEMLRPDYLKLIKILRRQDGQYVLQNQSTEPMHQLAYAKLRDKHTIISEEDIYSKNHKYKGLFIDIFYLEESNSKKLFNIYTTLYKKSYHLAALCPSPLLRKFSFKAIDIVYNKFLHVIFRNIARPFSKGRLRHCLGNGFPKPRYISDVERSIRVPFEGLMLPIPENYDHYLTTIYGNYMKLPEYKNIKPHYSHVKWID